MAKNMTRRPFPRGGIRTRLPVTIYRRAFSPTEISGLALWLDASSDTLYTTDAGPVVAVASPLDIAGCVGWWDADNAASITESGGLVSQWNDRSGQGNHATASTTARPTTGTRSLNGRNVLDFDGTANGMATSLADTATQTVFFVAVSDVASSAGRVWGFGGGNRGAFPDSGAWGFWRQQTAGAISFGTTASATSPSVACALFSSNSSLTTFGNGAQGTTNDPVDSFGGTFAIGKEASNFHNGYVAEIVIYNTALTTADRARVEAYLAAKWGISGVHAPATASSDPVGYWGDKSGNGRHAVQATSGSRPTISATAQNGRKQLLFDNSNDRLSLSSGLSLGTTGYSVLAVLRHLGGFTVWLEGGSLNPYFSTHPSINTGLYHWDGAVAVEATAALPVGSAAVVSGIISPSSRALYSQSALAVTGAGTSRAATIQNIGATSSGFNWNGNIDELLVYSKVLTTAERQRAERYLAARWGITLAPIVANADAQDWINRVYANGGSVSSATAAAVNSLCDSLDASGVRPLMYRMGIFAGSNLNAALVPLYRGPSLGGTQYGGTTDTNNAFVGVGTDYAETGASGGLTGNGTSKYLDTGLTTGTIGFSNGHLSVYHSQASGANQTRTWIGARDTNAASNAYLSNGLFSTSAVFGAFSGTSTANFNTGGSQTGAAAGHRLLSRTTATAMNNYYNAVSQASSATDITGSISGLSSTRSLFVAAYNDQGTASQYMNGRIMAYSAGLGLSQLQAEAFYTAMQTFQTALGRNV